MTYHQQGGGAAAGADVGIGGRVRGRRGEKPGSWFKTLFGFEEFDYRVQDVISVANNVMTSAVTGASYNVGDFRTPSLAELRAQGAAIPKKAGALKVSHMASSDVFEIHHTNGGAMFQAASQFNCLEFASPRVTPEDGVTQYQYDNTQGPACALAAGPATVYRNYFHPMPDGAIGQSRDNQINNLDGVLEAIGPGVSDLVKVTNGYVESSEEALMAANAMIAAADRDTLVGALKIGVHLAAEVPFDHRYTLSQQRPMGRLGEPKSPVLVSQTFNSALSIAYTKGRIEVWAPLATIVLDGTYEATLWAAALDKYRGTGSGVVYLTFIGGGVFGNSQEWINEAIAKSCARLSDIELDVRVCHYKSIDMRIAGDINRRVKLAASAL